jgi:D-glycero-D-manno-heptose 1,7-bisphosphate phosphatase
VPDGAAFLDRDGTIIHDRGYVRRAEDVELLPGAVDALRRAADAGLRLVVVSNQSGVGRGLVSPQELDEVHARMVELLSDAGVALDGAYYCPHAPSEDCACRKPKPGLLLRAVEELDLDPGRSVMIGDKLSDEEAGRAAGCVRTIRLGPGGWDRVTDLVVG